eukprot:11887962-Alexandrium_andersonii.AAC.1
MRAKVYSIVKAAELSDCDTAIFSAFGCGHHGHPPADVAEFFRDALWCTGYSSNLTRVFFTIAEDHRDGKWHNPRGAMEPFRDVFSLEHQHARLAPDAKPQPLEEDCHVPRGPCWWCNRCGVDDYIFCW